MSTEKRAGWLEPEQCDGTYDREDAEWVPDKDMDTDTNIRSDSRITVA